MADKQNFDVRSFLSDFEKEFQSTQPTTVSPEPQATAKPTAEPASTEEKPVEEIATAEQETPEDTEGEDVVEEEGSEEDLAPVEVVKEGEPEGADVVNDKDMHKRNEAFKKLREEKERLEQSDKFLAELASNYGVSKEELVAKIKDDQLKKQAKAQGMPVEQFGKMQQLEKEVSEIKQKYLAESFNLEAEKLVRKYNIPEKSVNEVFNKIGATGLDVINNPKLLEVAYKAISYDIALQQGRQQQLEQTKKRRETTASPSLGTKGTNVDTSATDMDKEIDAFLKEKIGIKK